MDSNLKFNAHCINSAGQLINPRIPFVFMDIRQITPSYFVSPQIDAAEIAELKEAGIATIICNRPDSEVTQDFQAETIRAAAVAANIAFVNLPITHQTLNAENVRLHTNEIDKSAGPVLAYCASGTRSTIIWALGQAERRQADDIIVAAQSAGYDLEYLRATLNALSKK